MTLSHTSGHHDVAALMLPTELPGDVCRCDVAANAQDAVLAGVQILVVHSDSGTCVHLQTLLGAAGATVICAYDIDTLLATMARTPPDLILADLDAPDADPCQSIRQVRLHERNKTLTTRMPAIAIGVRSAAPDVRAALQAGFDEHLAKPHTDVELVALIAAQVSNKPLRK
jgi:CheY-like chemotaxis protein